MNYKKIWDKLGIWISGLCLIHCLVLPLILIFIPVIYKYKYHYLFDEARIHGFFFISMILVALLSFLPAYKIHKQKKPFLVFISGLLIYALPLFFHDFFHSWELLISILASGLIIYAHWINKTHCDDCHH